jgi:CheY-like chemotaxis protein
VTQVPPCRSFATLFEEELKLAKVLVVDDDDNQRLLYRQELGMVGYEVEMASNGPQAIERVQAGDIDVVVLDIAMPGMDGLEVLQRILGVDRQLPVILNTAYSAYKDDFTSWPAEAYVTKSGDLSELRERLSEALSKRGVECPDKPRGAQGKGG